MTDDRVAAGAQSTEAQQFDRRRVLARLAVGAGVAGVTWSSPRIEGVGFTPSYAAAQSGAGLSATAAATAAQEVPETASTATASATFTSPVAGSIDVVVMSTGGVLLNGAGTVIAAHIHQAPAGSNGGVVVNLGTIVNGTLDFSGSVTVAQATIDAIAANPANYYLNIHTTAVGSGEIRGQLS